MNRQANLKRRRQMAASGAMPASLAGEFTLGEDAALCIIADECRVRGSSDLSLDEIADKAGVGRSAAKSALRKARELGLITVQNRGRLTNVVRIIAPEWLAWLQLGDGERRRLVDTRLTATFGFKDRYSVQEIEAVCKELDEAEQQGAIPPSTGSGD
jgi:DNA-binding transcriptional ArsR family regulator